MLGDWDLLSTLLRRTLQDGARRIALDDVRAPLLANTAADLAGFQSKLLVASRGVRGDWASRYVLAPVEDLATERLMETAARQFGVSPAELRRKNFITSFPHQTPVIMCYDAGDYAASLDAASRWQQFRLITWPLIWPVTALDVDPAAVAATRENARRNGVDLDVRDADALADSLPVTDVAVANITGEAVPWLPLRAPIAITSGYLDGQDVSLPGYRSETRRVREGWAADLFLRN